MRHNMLLEIITIAREPMGSLPSRSPDRLLMCHIWSDV